MTLSIEALVQSTYRSGCIKCLRWINYLAQLAASPRHLPKNVINSLAILVASPRPSIIPMWRQENRLLWYLLYWCSGSLSRNHDRSQFCTHIWLPTLPHIIGSVSWPKNSYLLHWNFDWKSCFVVFSHEWNEWENPQFNFFSQDLSNLFPTLGYRS